MWLLVAREPRPDAPKWPGRHWLAAGDAVVWPLLWVLLVSRIPVPAGVVWPMVTVVAVLCAIGRLHQALCVNHRYWFTSWRWARIAAGLLVIGPMLRWAVAV